MKVRLDHLFILADSEAQAGLLAEAGFSVNRRGSHRGGGTGNIVYRFRDALLELAYPIDPAEIAALGDIGFAERWRWRENGYAPFGVVFQVQLATGEKVPFDTWEYAPPFAPEMRWTVARAPDYEPLYMLAPFAPDARRSPKEPVLASIRISCPGIAEPSPVARFLADADVCEIVSGQEVELDLGFTGRGLPGVDLRPGLPLRLGNRAGASVTGEERDGF